MTTTLIFGLYARAGGVPPPACLRLDVLVLAAMGAVSPLCPHYRLAHGVQLRRGLQIEQPYRQTDQSYDAALLDISGNFRTFVYRRKGVVPDQT